jgi:PAS domain-containing protein
MAILDRCIAMRRERRKSSVERKRSMAVSKRHRLRALATQLVRRENGDGCPIQSRDFSLAAFIISLKRPAFAVYNGVARAENNWFANRSMGQRQANKTEMMSSKGLVVPEERWFRAVADYTNDWESWHAPDGRLIWVNPAVERLTGYSVDECLKMADYPRSLIDPADRKRIAEVLENALGRTSGEHIEGPVRNLVSASRNW